MKQICPLDWWCDVFYLSALSVMALLFSIGQSCFQTQNQGVVSYKQLHPKHQCEAIQLRHCECYCWRFATTEICCPFPNCLTLKFSFPSTRWMGTRRVWLPPRWTHGTKAPTLPIVSTFPLCRTTDRHFCLLQENNLKLTNVEWQTLARKSFHSAMYWIEHLSAQVKRILKEVWCDSFTFKWTVHLRVKNKYFFSYI